MSGELRLLNLAIKIKIPRVKGFRNSFRSPIVRAILASCLIICLVLFGVFSYYYIKYQKIVDKRMSGQIFPNIAKIYAEPRSVRVGQKADLKEIANYLRHAGYTEAGEQGQASSPDGRSAKVHSLDRQVKGSNNRHAGHGIEEQN